MSFDLKIANGDLVIIDGKLKTITDSEKLIQDILKICLTTIGANPMHPGYGSFLSRTIIGNPSHTSVLAQMAKSQLNNCLRDLKELQNIQVQSFQRVSADEQIGSIIDISVIRSQIDPRLFNITIKVITKGLKPIPASFVVNTI